MQGDKLFRGAFCAVLALSAAIAACSSDPFNATGGSLPAEVTQDSVTVQAAPIYPVDVQVVEPDLGEPFDERDLLYVGRRERDAMHDRSEWRLTPLLNIDFSANDRDSLIADVEEWKEIWLELPRQPGAGERDVARRFALATLTDTLSLALMDQPLGAVVADTVANAALIGDVLNASPFKLVFYQFAGAADTNQAAFQTVAQWIRAAETVALAVLDASGPVPEESTSTVDQLLMTDKNRPSLQIRFKRPTETPDFNARFRASYGFTHVEREDPPAQRLHVGTHLPSRIWLQFDLDASEIPGNATVNRATLLLRGDTEYSFGEFFGTLRAYEADIADVATVALGKALPIRRALTNFVAVEDDSLSIDLTEYFQRFVNGVIPSDRGVMLAISTPGELQQLVDLELFSTAAADSAMRPQLDVIFTPPADFQGKRR
jgi:hypothetical protein